MLLSELMKGVSFDGPSISEKDARDIVYDSRIAQAGDVFVCLPGANADGHRFAPDAYARGCRIFVAERTLSLPDDALVLITADSRRALSAMAQNRFGHPARELRLIGVTGTKGKTTVTHLIRQVLEASGIPTGIIGTTGAEFGKMHEKTANTTPESLELHRIFRSMVDAGCRCVCMEVSSQGLMAGRVDDIFFDLGVFTNLSPDHIGPNEHPDFENYRQWKSALFRRCSVGLFNADDPHASFMIQHASCEVRTFGFKQDCDYRAVNVELLQDTDTLGVRFSCRKKDGEREFTLAQPGRFSVYNGLAALAVAEWMGVPDAMTAAVLALARVPGRIEIVPAIPGATFIVDFAHNEASLRAILETVREYEPRRLICLFGSVGDRSQLRRAGLAKIASELCDYAILTSDNPGFEDPSAIISDIERAMTLPADRFVSIPDRAAAVKFAVDFAREGDIIVFAGKGHEDYQLVRGKKLPFSERELIAHFAAQRLAK